MSPLTIEAYEGDLAQLMKFLGDKVVIEAKTQDIRNYLEKLLFSIGGRSAARKVDTFRHFFKFLLIDRIIKTDPMLRVQYPKGWKVLPKFLTPPEIESILHRVPSKFTQGRLNRRNQAMFELLYASALRASEIVNARMVDLNLADRVLMVRGKGDKERIVRSASQRLKR